MIPSTIGPWLPAYTALVEQHKTVFVEFSGSFEIVSVSTVPAPGTVPMRNIQGTLYWNGPWRPTKDGRLTKVKIDVPLVISAISDDSAFCTALHAYLASASED